MKGSGDILMRYLKVTQHMSRLFREHFGRLHLTFPQALVLTVLGEEGPMPISALAERTGSANSTVSGIVDRLEKLGREGEQRVFYFHGAGEGRKLELARRERSGEDRRVIYVAATARYEQLRKKTETDVGGYFSSVMDTLTEREKDQIIAALSRLDEALLAWEATE